MKIALTATQEGLTLWQKEELYRYLKRHNCTVLIHGGCIGGDDEADQIAFRLRVPYRFIIPQSNIPEKAISADVFRGRVSEHSRVIIFPAGIAPDRNIEIINRGQRLVALPRSPREQLRSGTWMTVRHARRILGRDKVDIIEP